MRITYLNKIHDARSRDLSKLEVDIDGTRYELHGKFDAVEIIDLILCEMMIAQAVGDAG